ncbi:MAG: hypothetical protein K5837_01740 [Candidatus Saccharibacteria bacterium]|nr:hypothetical protein [Candidatus Saccharibacteria bacterium]
MSRRKKSILKGLGLSLFALILGTASPYWQFMAHAEGEETQNDPLYVRLLNASVSSTSAGGATSYNATWTIDNQDITLDFPSSLSVVDTEAGKAIPFEDDQAIKSGLSVQTQGNFCGDYLVIFGASDGFSTDLSCNYYEPTDTGGDFSTMSLAQHIAIPGEADYYTLEVVSRNQQPGPSERFTLQFDNVDEYDAEEGKYVIVHSNDQPLAGQSFKITSQDAQIGARGDEHGTQYTVELEHDPFFASSYAVSGDFDPETAQVTLIGAEGYEYAPELARVGDAYVFSMQNVHFPGFGVNLAIQDKHEIQPPDPNAPQPHPGVETHSGVTVRSSAGYEDQKSFYLSRIMINDSNVLENEECEWNPTNCPAPYHTDDLRYNKEENVNTVELAIGSLFIYKVVNKVTVNGVDYNIPVDYSNRASWLAHYSGQMVGFVLNIPYADDYEIVIDMAETPGNEQVIGNFLWTNDENEKTDPEGRPNDAYIGHSTLRVVSVLCHITENDADDVYFNVEEGDEVPEGCVFEYDPDGEDHPYGSLVVPEGSTVTVRLKTEYGYQVTSFGINNNEISVDEGKTAEYTFGIFRGNFHLGAVVEQTDDEVNASSTKVRSGAISLGGVEIDEGTAMLTVGDADLTDEEKEKFQNEAGDYNVSTYLSIDLDQIFYDGHGGYWKGTEMKELEQEAEISLVLEEGINGNQVIIVHKKHDGTYELIPTRYDAATRTLTFKTSSFSDYAIASKTAAQPAAVSKQQNADPVKTLDNIMQYVALLMGCTTVAAIVIFKMHNTSSSK